MDGAPELTAALLRWYRPRRSAYPWRRTSGPYAVWVSEVMLQQTQAARVAPAFERFLARFPDVASLAAAPTGDVLRTWDRLGYPRRAVALSHAARSIVLDHGGAFPRRREEMMRLPGVGPYTASAIASIAFGDPVPALDTNVRRVIARTLLGAEPHEVTPARVETAARDGVPARTPGAWNQALMDVGREHCRAVPRCDGCPLARVCGFRASGRDPARSPRRSTRFEGSARQVRGAVLRALVRRSPVTVASLVATTGFEAERVRDAVASMHDDRVVRAGPRALSGALAGVVRLPS